ncbi:MAG: hypothetical protein JOY62_05370 [Acidobacteriaceae bacterium]|nr:hypothetical protein [Acidobacteriaceae bacterium]MBV9779386.1 hypothetical protein [Acidobacteriaceae bacterium]
MQTRRDLLFGLGSAAIGPALSRTPRPEFGIEILAEKHCLSEESAKGFRLLDRRSSARVIVLPGLRELSYENALAVRSHALYGGWLILESGLAFAAKETVAWQIRLIRDVFGLRIREPVTIRDNNSSYVRYTWPVRHFVRHFSAITPIECSSAERIAEFAGVNVCARRRVGNGGIIFLGSMLGPGLVAEEREAHQVGNVILQCL